MAAIVAPPHTAMCLEESCVFEKRILQQFPLLVVEIHNANSSGNSGRKQPRYNPQ